MANHMDLSGKLVIKAQLGDDIRLMPIHNEDITYDELVLMMQRVFRGKITSTDELVIKYKDQDNDLITIFDNSDLTFAIQFSRLLKITLFVNGRPRPLASEQVREVCNELRQVRDRVNYLLDTLGGTDTAPGREAPARPTPDKEAGDAASANPATQVVPVKPTPTHPQVAHAPPQPPVQAAPPVTTSKEFDPLTGQRAEDNSQNNVMSSFGISNDVGPAGHPGSPQHQQHQRTGTPDSISSLGSSAGTQRYPQQQGGYPQEAGGPQTMTGFWEQYGYGEDFCSDWNVYPVDFGAVGQPQYAGQAIPGQTMPTQAVAGQQQANIGPQQVAGGQVPGAFTQAYTQNNVAAYNQNQAAYSGPAGPQGQQMYPGSTQQQPGAPYPTPQQGGGGGGAPYSSQSAAAVGAAGQQMYPGYQQQQGYPAQSSGGQAGSGAQGGQAYPSFPGASPGQGHPSYRMRYPTPQGQYPQAFQPR